MSQALPRAGLIAAALLVLTNTPAHAKRRGGASVGTTELGRTCEKVRAVDHGLDLLAAPLAQPGTHARPLPERSYTELTFAAGEWLAFRELGAPSEVQVMSVDGGEAVPVSPQGRFCAGVEAVDDGILFHCRVGDAGSTEREFFAARPPDWKPTPDRGDRWSHTLRARRAERFAANGHPNHDVFEMPTGPKLAVRRTGGGTAPFLVEYSSEGYLAPPASLPRRHHYPASFLEASRVAAVLVPPEPPERSTAPVPDASLYVLDLETRQTWCISTPGTHAIASPMGASRRFVLYLRGRLPGWGPLEVRLADVEAGTDHRLGVVAEKATAVVKPLPRDRFLVVLHVESPRTKFKAHFLLVDGASQTVRRLLEPVENLPLELWDVQVSPNGHWLRYRDRQARPWVVPVPAETRGRPAP